MQGAARQMGARTQAEVRMAPCSGLQRAWEAERAYGKCRCLSAGAHHQLGAPLVKHAAAVLAHLALHAVALAMVTRQRSQREPAASERAASSERLLAWWEGME